jgi:hypothetical protein
MSCKLSAATLKQATAAPSTFPWAPKLYRDADLEALASAGDVLLAITSHSCNREQQRRKQPLLTTARSCPLPASRRCDALYKLLKFHVMGTTTSKPSRKPVCACHRLARSAFVLSPKPDQRTAYIIAA